MSVLAARLCGLETVGEMMNDEDFIKYIRKGLFEEIIPTLDLPKAELEGELRGHKTALRDISAGEDIIKYGYPIGRAVVDIKKGEHVHTHNIKTELSGILEYKYEPVELPSYEKKHRTFMDCIQQHSQELQQARRAAITLCLRAATMTERMILKM